MIRLVPAFTVSALLLVGMAFSAAGAQAGGFGLKKIRSCVKKRVRAVGDTLQHVGDEVGQAARDATRSQPVKKAAKTVRRAADDAKDAIEAGAQAVQQEVRSACRRVRFGFGTSCRVAHTPPAAEDAPAALGTAAPTPGPPPCPRPC